jgi:hypothetical protein
MMIYFPMSRNQLIGMDTIQVDQTSKDLSISLNHMLMLVLKYTLYK